MSPTSIVAYLVLFATVGFAFLFASLLLGRFLRPHTPTPQKRESYECGEPAVGSSYVQFDLRFYVVALLFIIFDVEVAFFFPWAAVFGKTTQLTDTRMPKVVAAAEAPAGAAATLAPATAQKLRELGVTKPAVPDSTAGVEENSRQIESQANTLALTAIADIAVFFAVLLVGFAYVWYRGDLDWVRAVGPPEHGEDREFEKPLVGTEAH